MLVADLTVLLLESDTHSSSDELELDSSLNQIKFNQLYYLNYFLEKSKKTKNSHKNNSINFIF